MRAIFDWITSNVKYATGSSHPAIEPHEVMTRLVAVCGGYSTLYKAMLDIIGIKMLWLQVDLQQVLISGI
ncbi:transglutaminase-like domain-containing protein [Mycoplasmopsis felis]|uniref:transglutaminase-like domain-containing protein n=1 Tax=Mycoplasmopsis felis TaxID=33923 RepID=UPI0021AE46AC|nr:transglutaminase-like domain-containing protein [Mycoplasmopsis felis]UWV79144.1 transglutaminase-like domain-containing protein [Mycoplasmopsis felis]